MDYGQGQAATNNLYNNNLNQNAANTKASRLQGDIERLQSLVKRVHRERERIQAHSITLGYYANTPSTDVGAKVQPISNTLTSTLDELENAMRSLAESIDIIFL